MAMRSLGLENLADLDDSVDDVDGQKDVSTSGSDVGEGRTAPAARPRPAPQPVARPRPAPAGAGRTTPPTPPGRVDTPPATVRQSDGRRAGVKNNSKGVGITPALNAALSERWAAAREDVNSLLAQALDTPVTREEAERVQAARTSTVSGVVPRRINPTDEDLDRLDAVNQQFPFLSRSALVCLLLNRHLGLPVDA